MGPENSGEAEKKKKDKEEKEADENKKGKTATMDDKSSENLKVLIMTEAMASQEDYKGHKEHRYVLLGSHPCKAHIVKVMEKESRQESDMEIEYKYEDSKYDFKILASDLAAEMIKKKYGCTVGDGYLLSKYDDYSEGPPLETLEAVIQKLNVEIESEEWDLKKGKKKKSKEKKEDSKEGEDDDEKENEDKKGESRYKTTPDMLKMAFPLDVLFLGPLTYGRVVMMVLVCIKQFFKRQTIYMDDLQCRQWVGWTG